MFISRGIIEQIITPYEMRVRIPFLNRAKSGSNSTPTKELAIATVSVPPNFTPNLQLGDVVFVGFEDNDYSKPVILGTLYRENVSNTKSTIALSSLVVDMDTHLSPLTYIGKVQPTEIEYLSGCTDNIQNQITRAIDGTSKVEQMVYDLQEQVEQLQTQLQALTERVTALEHNNQ